MGLAGQDVSGLNEFAKACQAAAKAGGEVLLAMQGNFKTREKAPADLVTEADVASQKVIRELVLSQFPDHGFVGEEDEATEVEQVHEFTWIVDPLDGTTNYVHGMENYSVSVALQRRHEIVAAAVYDPNRSRCFHATLGEGAYCNEQPLQVSNVGRLSDALVAASFPPLVQRESAEVDRFLEVLVRSQAVRRLGSAALNLCYVANGCLDAYWATSVKKWDVAAGLLLVQEAGGVISNLEGGDVDLEQPQFVAASQPSLQGELLPLLNAQKYA